MKTLVADAESPEWWRSLMRNPWTFDLVSTEGGERKVVGQGIEWPAGGVDLHFDSMEGWILIQPDRIETEWHKDDA